MHTMARVKNSSLTVDQQTEPDVRERGEAAIVKAAADADRQHHRRGGRTEHHYAADPDRITIVPPGVDLHAFHPCDQPKSRAQLGVPQDAQVILFVGRIQPLKAPDVLIKAVAELARRSPERRAELKLIIIGSPSGPDSGWSRTLAPLTENWA